jgi:hypothetical protein
VAAAGSPSSPLGGGVSSSSSSTAWNYVVQHLDVAAALQQMPSKEEATQANVVTDLLLRWGCSSRTHRSVSTSPCAHVCPFGSKSMAQCLQVINRHGCTSQCMKHGMTGITPRCRVRFYNYRKTLHALHPQLLTPACSCSMLQVQPAGFWLVARHHSSWRLHNTLARPCTAAALCGTVQPPASAATAHWCIASTHRQSGQLDAAARHWRRP